MSITPNPGGRSATVKKTGVTGGKADGGAPRQNKPFGAKSVARSPKRLPTTLKPMKRGK